MKICVVLVTFNRKRELEKTLGVYEAQTAKPCAIVVVDNHSTDGTAALLADWERQSDSIRHVLVSMPENVGGSGGFYAGMEKALTLDCDWIFVSDDDALPRTDTLERLIAFCESAWYYEGDKWIWEFTIPEGSTASVTLPGEHEATLYQSGSYKIVR